MRNLHDTEVIKCSLHARWVRIIGVDDQLVFRRGCQLRPVIGRYVMLDGMVDLLWGDTKMEANGDRC